MPRISSFKKKILLLQPMDQTIQQNRLSLKWERICEKNVRIKNILDNIRNADGLYSVSRRDIFQRSEPFDKLVMIMWWGYPKGMINPVYQKNILHKAEEIASLLQEKAGRHLAEKEFKQLFLSVKSKVLRGLGLSTISKFFYFFNIFEGKNRAVIVDRRVSAAMTHFDDFVSIHDRDLTSRYLGQIRQINSQACQSPSTGPSRELSACK